MQAMQEVKRALQLARAELRDQIRQLEAEVTRIDKAIVLFTHDEQPPAEPKAKAPPAERKPRKKEAAPRVPIGPDADRALALLRERGPMKRTEVRDALGVSDQRMSAIMAKMRAAGQVYDVSGGHRRDGVGKTIAATANPQPHESLPAYSLPGYRPARQHPVEDANGVAAGSGFGRPAE